MHYGLTCSNLLLNDQLFYNYLFKISLTLLAWKGCVPLIKVYVKTPKL